MRAILLGFVISVSVACLAFPVPVHCGPLPAHEQQQQQDTLETLESLHLSEPGPGTDDTSVREKRTIGPLRQLFPGLSQIVDRKIQQITRSLFRVIGRLVLGGGAGGGGTGTASSSSSSSGGGRKVSITLPTYPPSEDDEDEEDEDSTTSTSTDSAASADESSTPADTENQLAGSESQVSEVRVQVNDREKRDDHDQDQEQEGDLKPAASGDNLADADEETADLENEADGGADEEDNRNKRFLPFNLNGGAAGGSGGSGGGSGNFLFDIIRLIAGSGTTQERDEAENAPIDGSTSSAGASASAGSAEGKDDGYQQEGVPGPITRLFVIANRGIANLVQDLILRLAQTSERLVNFKARLITSII